MGIYAIGVDILEADRIRDAIDRHPGFIKRIYTENEIKYCESKLKTRYLHYAARFAAKEAVAKALGVGIGVVGWKDIEILRDSAHKPILQLQGNAEKYAKELNLNHWSISLSHTHTYAIAMAAALSEA